MYHRRRGKRLALVTGSVLLALVAALAWNWERALDVVYALRTGYEFVWMPDGVVPGGRRTLNNSGQVAVEYLDTFPQSQGGSWSVSSGDARRFEPFREGERLSNAPAINGNRIVFGGIETVLGGNCEVFLWTPERGMVRQHVGGLSIYLADINNKNDVVGAKWWTQGHTKAFVWNPESGTREPNGLMEGGDSFATAINSQGWITGSATAADGLPHPVVWKPHAEIVDLGCPPGYSRSITVAINDRNEILVDAEKLTPATGSRGSNERAPFLWSGEKGYVALPLPTGYGDVSPLSINNQGHVLLRGTRSEDDASVAFIFADGKLTQLPLARRGVATVYTWLNDKGWLAGYVDTEKDGGPELRARRGFVARPYRFGSR